MIVKKGWAGVAWPTIVALLWLTMMERAVHALFVVSLAALGVSPTLIAIPLLFSAFIYPLGLHKRWPHSERFLSAATVVALAAILVTIVAPGSIAVIAAAVSVIALTVLLFDVIARYGKSMLLPCVLAVLLAITLRTINNTAAPGLTQRGIVLLIALVAVAAAVRWFSRDGTAERDVPGAAVVVAFLLVQFQMLASPSAVATLHAPHPLDDGGWYFALVIGCQLGLLAGLRCAPRIAARFGVTVAAGAVHFVSTVLLITGAAYTAAPLWLLVAQATAVLLLAHGLSNEERSVKRTGAWTGALQVIWWLLVVFHAFSSKWPFLPSALRPVLEGKASVYLVLSFAILPIAVLLDSRRRKS